MDRLARRDAALKRGIVEKSLGLHGPGLFYALRTLKACDGQ